MKTIFPSLIAGSLVLVGGIITSSASMIFRSVGEPIDRVVLSQVLAGAVATADRTQTNKYEKVGQTIEHTSLDGDEVNIDTLFFKVDVGTTLPASGTHQLDLWIGEWDTSDDTADATSLLHQQYDVSGFTFVGDEFYGFRFDTPISFDQTKDYTFQIWWTSDDDDHVIKFARANGQGSGVDGGFITDNSSSTTLPFDASPAQNQDLVFYMQSAVPEPSSALLLVVAAGIGCLRRSRG